MTSGVLPGWQRVAGNLLSRVGCGLGGVLAFVVSFTGFDASAKDDAAVKLFNKTCAPCHSTDGRARTPAARKLGVKDLKLSKLSDKQLVFQILEGRQDLTKKSNMPAFKEKLTQEQIDQLIPIVKAFRK